MKKIRGKSAAFGSLVLLGVILGIYVIQFWYLNYKGSEILYPGDKEKETYCFLKIFQSVGYLFLTFLPLVHAVRFFVDNPKTGRAYMTIVGQVVLHGIGVYLLHDFCERIQITQFFVLLGAYAAVVVLLATVRAICSRRTKRSTQ